ncbi:MAG: acyl transferase [Bacteroidetes bacterium]|nr:acyl transferase [Bacteroidota bacterium]
MEISINNIFNIKNEQDFRRMTLDIFRYQAENNIVYKQYLQSLRISIDSIDQIEKIPFIPVEFFKSFEVITGSILDEHQSKLFTSSGTTGQITSKHYVKDVSIYEKSFTKAFELFYGNIHEYCILALLPSYLEREGSSLVYMADDLITKSKHHESGFYLHNYDELILTLQNLQDKKQKTLLLGVTYALLDVVEQFPLFRGENNLIVMETGGMKGKRKEMIREELHAVLCEGFGVNAIHSEYGMTELLSQAYSKGNGVFNCPPWMKILIRDTNDPFSYLPHGRTGGINVIDLANINSCSFIATQDLGKTNPNTSFEVLGRFDNSDIRGCNLLVQ